MTHLPFFRFAGPPAELGAAYGATCRDLIARHLQLSLERLGAVGMDAAAVRRVAAEYRPFVRDAFPSIDAELTGLADGAGIALEEAYALQLRAELFAEAVPGAPSEPECTTFALEPARGGIAAQNADLPEAYGEVMIVVDLAPDDGARVLMAVPAGQVSYIGISDRGMAAFANTLNCTGWRRGFPRYLYTRFALQHATATDAVAALRGLHRSSSRNILLLDAQGDALDFENTPTSDSVLSARDGVLTHANHYLAADLAGAESSPPPYLGNSVVRQTRIDELLAGRSGAIDSAEAAVLLRDRADAPDAISVEAQDAGADERASREGAYVTAVSVIAEPGAGRIWVAPGPPSASTYTAYSFADGVEVGNTL